MKRFSLVILFALLTLAQTSAQNLQTLVSEGIALHDQGDYKAAIAKYDEALALAPDNPKIIYEKAFSYQAMGKYKKVIQVCEEGIKKNKKSEDTSQLYMMMANCYDIEGKPAEALKTYDRALKHFEDFHLIHFNKGVTLMGMNDYAAARESLQTAIRCNPKHPSSHYYLSAIMADAGNPYPAMMAASRFLVLEPDGERATKAYPIVRDAFANVIEDREGGEGNGITINLSSAGGDEDNFSHIELMVGIAVVPNEETDSLNLFSFYKDIPFDQQTQLQRFTTCFNIMCGMLGDPKEGKVGAKGFFHEYYGEFFCDLRTAGHVETYCAIINVSNEELLEEIQTWAETHKAEVDAFYRWLGEYLEAKAEGK